MAAETVTTTNFVPEGVVWRDFDVDDDVDGAVRTLLNNINRKYGTKFYCSWQYRGHGFRFDKGPDTSREEDTATPAQMRWLYNALLAAGFGLNFGFKAQTYFVPPHSPFPETVGDAQDLKDAQYMSHRLERTRKGVVRKADQWPYPSLTKRYGVAMKTKPGERVHRIDLPASYRELQDWYALLNLHSSLHLNHGVIRNLTPLEELLRGKSRVARRFQTLFREEGPRLTKSWMTRMWYITNPDKLDLPPYPQE